MENVIVPSVALVFMVKLLVPVTPPENVVDMDVPVLPIVRVPTVALVASVIGFPKFKPVVPTKSVAVALPVVFPRVMVL